MAITKERAERIAKAHACEHCGEYSFRKLRVVTAPARLREELGVEWHVTKTCGVCGMEQELGLDDEGEIVFVG